MSGKSLNFPDFLSDVLLAPYKPAAMRRLMNSTNTTYSPSPGDRLRFPSPCELEGCESCTGLGCDCACHLVDKEDS